ncbi:MAG: ABC transporter permease [Solirubrobacteraceae bacterium MAG38_C4-C5]|nr:ABC transporter permease [Candidatus Siliceabacter maunaloa]
MSVLRSPLALVGAGLVAALVVAAVLAPVIAPYDPGAASGTSYAPPSLEHPVGTNNLGQDMLSRLIWGARASVSVALGATLLALTIGVVVGVGAALVGGLVDTLAMRVVDVLLALPRLPLLVVVAALAGAGRLTVTVVIGLIFWPPMARIVRSRALSLRRRGFVECARGFGAGLPYLIRRHLLPALGPVIVALFISVASNAVLLEASLAFLGLADPTGVSWGLDINRALAEPGIYFTSAWLWWVLPTGFAITLAILGFTLLGVGLEPVLNPRWERGS